jgi:hypothetical protein
MVRALRSPAAVVRRSERKCFPLCGRQRRRRILDVRAADMQEEMAEQLFRSVSSDEDRGNTANIAASGSEQSHTARCASS